MSDRGVEEELARRMGVGEEHIRKALAHPRGLASGLYAQGAIDTDRYEEFVAALRDTVAKTVAQRRTLPMICGGCGARWRVRNAHPSRKYGCRKCRKPLVVDLSGREGEEADEPGEARELPPEVLSAMEKPANLFGKYVLLGEVGRGGMGRVYRGYDTELGRTVALKVMLFQSEEDLARFRQEALLAAKLDHPGIVQVHEMGEVEGRPYIAMQLVEGKSLEAARMAPRRAVEAVRDAARAIAYAHRHGVIHRDVKPSNLLESDHGRIRVTDFGLAKQAGSASLSGSVVGTPSFMSPEQARGDTRNVGPRSDVYSLGATLYGLLVGDLPYPGNNVAEILHKVAFEDPVPLRRRARVAGEIETIVLKAMEKDPERRYQTATDLADDLERFLQGEPIQARRASVVYRLRKTLAKRQAVLLIGILGLGAAAGVAAFLLPRLMEERLAKERAEAEVRSLRDLTTLWTQVVLAKQGFHSRANDAAKVRSKIRDLLPPVSEFIRANPKLPQGYYIRARALIYLDDLSAAEADLRAAVRLAPDFAPGYALLGRVKIEEYQWKLYGSPDAKRSMLHEASPVLAEAREELAKGLKRGSIETWGLIKTQEDEVAQVLAQALWLRFGENKVAASEQLLRDADAKEPAAEYCNWMAHSGNSWQEHARWQSRAVELMPLWGKPYLDRGIAREQMGEMDPALEDYTRAVELMPHRSVGWVNRSVVYFKKKMFDKSLSDIQEAIRIDPGLGNAYAIRAHLRQVRGEREEAFQDLERALALEPSHAGAYATRIRLRLEKGEFKQALPDCEKLIELEPKSAQSYFNRAHVRANLRDFPGALADYSRSIELKPEEAQAYNNRASARLALKDLKGAQEDAEMAVKLAPEMAEAFATRSTVRQAAGDLAGAIADVDRAIELKPALPVSHFYRGVLTAVQGDLKAALAYFDRAQQRGFDRADLHLARGRVYVEQSQKEPARQREHLESALKSLELALERKVEILNPTDLVEVEKLVKAVRNALGR